MRVHISDEVDLLQQVNQRLDEQADELVRSNRDLEQFAYVASHDLQEPLRKVASFCQLLQRRYAGQLDERADQYIALRRRRRAADAAADQRPARLLPDRPHDVRLRRRSTCARSPWPRRSQVEMTRAELDGEIVVGDLPPVQGDPPLLRQLLVNLVSNALKFRRPDAAPVVHGGRAARRRGWEITVSDNGIGIEPEFADKIFVIFQRLHGRDVYAGTGIGLAIVKKIVEYHGGRIWVDTGPPRRAGTRHPVHSPGGCRGDDRQRGAAHDRSPRCACIDVLLVEDDPGDVLMTREAFDEYLRNRLDVVTDGAEALTYLRKEGPYADAPRPDLILLDLNLPRRDGREVLQEIKDDPDLRHIPVVVLTTSQADEDVLRSYQLHANAYVTKPVDFERFIEAVKQIDHFFVSVVQLPSGRNG